MAQHETLLILDFGSQFTQLIARRVREHRVYSEIHAHDFPIESIRAMAPKAIVLSGGPDSVYDEEAPGLAPELFRLGVPILGICYGMQRVAHDLGGQVVPSSRREYGRATVDVSGASRLFEGLDARQTVWMSHGDHVDQAPPGFRAVASTESAPVVAIEDTERGVYCIQFHPEVSHTVNGSELLRNFLFPICGFAGDWGMASYLDEAVETIRQQVGEGRVLCALSGGVDSSVMTALVERAVGDRLTAVFVDTGLLRRDERRQVEHSLRDGLGLPIRTVDASAAFFDALQGVRDPEAKRKTIGRLFIETFEQAVADLQADDAGGTIDFLAQGTLYPDVIESTAVKGPSAVIKSHHNVGGLPERLGFALVEPLRNLFKDEVRQLGRELGLAEALISRHPFPGPGLAVRILGEVTPEAVWKLQEADAIFIEELRESGWYDRVSQAGAVLLPVRSVGVMGDGRTYEQVVALRSVDTEDFMTADWSRLPVDLLARVSNRIVGEVTGINRVVFDITSKPPGTIEWE